MDKEIVRVDEVPGINQWHPGHTRPWKDGEVVWIIKDGSQKVGTVQEMLAEKDRPSMWRYNINVCT